MFVSISPRDVLALQQTTSTLRFTIFPGSSLLDVISSAMNISKSVMARAEIEYGACTQLMRAAEEISAYIDNAQGQKVNLNYGSYVNNSK